jgi:hypothetical protein
VAIYQAFPQASRISWHTTASKLSPLKAAPEHPFRKNPVTNADAGLGEQCGDVQTGPSASQQIVGGGACIVGDHGDSLRRRSMKGAQALSCASHAQAERPTSDISSFDDVVGSQQNRLGTLRPRAFAVFILITRSSFVGCATGRSVGLAPLKILAT